MSSGPALAIRPRGTVLRGSQKHILDWVDQPGFPEELTELLRPTGAVVEASDSWMPLGHDDPTEARLHSFGPRVLPGIVDWRSLRDWWLLHKTAANTPNWDLVSTCAVGKRRGLVLVEAKAHAAELTEEGKKLSKGASWRSIENHAHIASAIEDARRSLNVARPGVRIRRESHYQLSNRVAFAWKLADLGLETILVYLGFLGARGVSDLGQPFRSQGKWVKTFESHARAVLPEGFAGSRIAVGDAGMWLIVRSRRVLDGDRDS